ncbi:MAG: acyl-CoA thioesterase [Bradymonadia bacterium]
MSAPVNLPAVSLDRNVYGFQTEIRARLSETDAVGIVFFGSFAAYMDVGRMDYLNHLGLTRHGGPVKDLIPGAVVQQAAQFHSPARYNDILVLHVRVCHIGRSSYTFHFLITHKRKRAVVSTGSLTLVWLDETFKPITIPESFRKVVREFEGPHLLEGEIA